MDFFTMKRKNLQSLCKKHKIPANLKNIEMAERLSLIYKEKENEKPVSRRLRTDKEKSNVEIIILDSDSDTEVQMEEAPDIVAVAEKEIEMNNVNVEHFVDEVPSSGLKHSAREPDQILATSPLSEVRSSDRNIRPMVDSDIVAVAEKDSNEMHNVNVEHFLDDVHSSGLKHSEGEPDQFPVTSPMSEVKSSDSNIRCIADTGTSGGNADVNEVKSASSQQMSQGQEESQMKLRGEKSEDNVRSVYLEEYKQTSFTKEKIEENQEFYHATPADLNDHHMVDSGTASGHMDACEVISESLQTTSQGLEMSTIKLTPERNDNVRPFYVEDNMQMSANVLEQFGNYMMVRDDSDWTPVQFLPTSDLNIHKMSVKDTCEEGMLKLSEKTCMVADPEECIGFSPNELETSTTKGSEAETYFDQTTHGDVMETYNRKESMEVDKMEKENNQEDCTTDQGDVCKYCDNSDVFEKDCEEKTDLAAEPDQSVAISPGTAGENADVCEVISESSQQMKFPSERSDYNVGNFNLEENNKMSGNKAQIEDNQELYAATPSAPNVHLMVDSGLTYLVGEPDQFLMTSPLSEVKSSDHNIHHMGDSGTVTGKADACEVKSPCLHQMSHGQGETKMKLQCERSENNVGSFNLEENMQRSDNKEHIEDNHELSPATPTDLDVLHMVDSDTCEEGMLKLSEKTSMVAEPEECIGFSLNELETSTTKGSEAATYFDQTTQGDVMETYNRKESMQVDKLEKENNQEGCTTDQGTVAGNADSCEVKSASLQQMSQAQEKPKMKLQCDRSENNVGSFYLEKNMQMSDNKEHIEDNQELSPATPADLDVLHMVDSGAAAGHADDCEVNSASLQGREEAKMKPTPERSDNVETFYDEENMYISVNTEQIVDKLELNQAEPSEYEKVFEEFGNYKMNRKDSDGTPVQFLPNSDLNMQELIFRDTASGDEDAYKSKLNSLSKVLPIASEQKSMIFSPKECIRFSPNELEASTSKGSEADTYFDQTTLSMLFDNSDVGGVGVEDENHSSSTKRKMSDVCMVEDPEECIRFSPNELEVSTTKGSEVVDTYFDQTTLSKLFDNSDVGGLGVEDENPSSTTNTKRKSSDVVDTNSDEKVKSDELVPTVSQSNEMMSCTFSLQQLFASDTSEEEMVKLSEKEKTCMVADLEACIRFSPDDLEAVTTKGFEDDKYFDPTILESVVMETCRIDNVEKENNQEDCFSSLGEVSKFVDNRDVGADELVQTVPQPSEVESFNFSLQQLFALDTPFGDEHAYQKKLHSPNVQEEDCISVQGEVRKFVDNSDVYDDIDGVGEVSRKRKSSDEDDISAHSDDDLKADELVRTVPQSSEMESCNFSLQQLFAADNASGDEEAYKTKLDSPSKATPIASGEKSVFSPKLHESSTTHKQMEIEMSLSLKRTRDSIGRCDMKENINIDKKEEVGSIMSKTKFAKRQPLQDLQQN